MFNFSNIIDAVKNVLAEAETVSPEIIAVANEVRQGASALGLLTPATESEITGHIMRLTGSLDGLAPVVTGYASDAERLIAQGQTLATALVGNLQMVQGTSTAAGTTTGAIALPTHNVTISAVPVVQPTNTPAGFAEAVPVPATTAPALPAEAPAPDNAG